MADHIAANYVAVLESVQEDVLRSSGKKLIPAMVTGVIGKGLLSTNHANEDQGSFVFYANRENILLDPGDFEQTALKHSLPLIGDPEKMSLNATTPARLQNAWSQGKWRSVTVDATDAYNQSIKSPLCASRVRRIFAQFGDSALVILDDVLPSDPAEEVTAQYQAGVPATVSRSRPPSKRNRVMSNSTCSALILRSPPIRAAFPVWSNDLLLGLSLPPSGRGCRRLPQSVSGLY